mgnify:CR=1 FL=1
MPAQKKTTLGLNQWIGSEYPKRIDFVEDNKIINDELLKRVEYTDVATEEKKGIAQIHSLDTVENQSNELQNIIANNLQSQVSDFIKKLNHDEILTVKSLVKYLSKLLKPATENKFGIIDFQTIKQVSPKPNLSPYMRWDKGYRNGNNSDYIIRANTSDLWTPNTLNMYDANGTFTGSFHTNGIRAYYKVPNRAGGGWCEIMDNHDMAARDTRMNNMDSDRANIRNLAQDAWNKGHDAQMNRILTMRLAGYYQGSPGSLEARERQGYVVTGLIGNAPTGGFGQIQYVQMRASQFQYGNGTWFNTPHV